MPACHVEVFALAWRLERVRPAPLRNKRETHEEGEEKHGVMARSIRLRKPGWVVRVQKGQGEVWCSSGWKDENNEMERGKTGEERESYPKWVLNKE